jgi:hypothetical protein
MQNHVATTRSHKTFSKLLLRSLFFAAPVALAFVSTAPAKAEVTDEMAGVSAAVTGDVTLAKASGEVGVLVESGMPVYLGDRITTSPNSGMQILLLDETVFTIGPDSDVAIDEFVYDPATGDGRIVADMARGVMRFVTGKIPLNNPASMDINLPVGSIGIRGTIGLVRSVSAEEANQIVPGAFDTSTPEAANQQVFMAVNQGPGLQRNDTTSRPGAFAVNDQTGNSQNVTGENFGVFVSENAVTTPTRFPENISTFDFSTNLVRTASRSSDDGSSGGSSAGGSAPTAPLSPSQTQQANTQTGSAMAGSLEVALAQVGSTASASSSSGEITQILGNVESTTSSSSDSTFTFDGLRQVSSGSVTTGGVNANSGSLSYTFQTTVNFATRTLNIQFSSIVDSSAELQALSGNAVVAGYDFSSVNGAAAFASGDFTYQNGCTSNSSAAGCSATATFTDASNIDFKLTTNAESAGASGSAPLN